MAIKIKDYLSVSFIDTIHKFLTYHDFLIAVFPPIQKLRIRRVRKKQQKYLSQLARKDKFKVILFLQTESVWKYDALYRELEKSPLFDPIVVVSPYNVHIIYDKNECINVMKKACEYAQKKNYNYICSYDFENKKWLNVKKMLQPDIVFFSKPYKDTLPKYHIYNYEDCLTLYAPYGINCMNRYRENYNLPFDNLLWKLLLETEFQRTFAQKYSLCKGDNVFVSGALVTEKLIDPSYYPKDVWKSQNCSKKKVIWAPHHTVDYLFNFSNFLSCCDQMVELAKKYKDSVQFAFKPHPVLKFKLINIWGKEKTEKYYKQWIEMENTQLEEGDYMDLFITSDAMIHDSGSFTVEYLYSQKPVLFMVRDEHVKDQWNPFGQECFDLHYHSKNMEQVEQFLVDVVINDEDPLKAKRELFFKEYLYPKDGVLPSLKVVNYIKKQLKK